VNLPFSTSLLKKDVLFDPVLYKAAANTLAEMHCVQPDINQIHTGGRMLLSACTVQLAVRTLLVQM
jgi:hypothetical protein